MAHNSVYVAPFPHYQTPRGINSDLCPSLEHTIKVPALGLPRFRNWVHARVKLIGSGKGCHGNEHFTVALGTLTNALGEGGSGPSHAEIGGGVVPMHEPEAPNSNIWGCDR